jgi:hypothetical protein
MSGIASSAEVLQMGKAAGVCSTRGNGDVGFLGTHEDGLACTLDHVL